MFESSEVVSGGTSAIAAPEVSAVATPVKEGGALWQNSYELRSKNEETSEES